MLEVVTSEVALVGGSMSHPLAWIRADSAAAAPVIPEALVTRTGTLLGGTVVVVGGGGGCAFLDECDGLVVGVTTTDADAADVLEAEGWISLRTSTVAATNRIKTMPARTTGNPPVRRPELR
jgi:hypothetical protein